jgi:hypothetical protein
MAEAHPGLIWQPTDVAPENMASIAAWAAHAGLPNLRPPVMLDASAPGWADAHTGQDMVILVNLLHLMSLRPLPAGRAGHQPRRRGL